MFCVGVTQIATRRWNLTRNPAFHDSITKLTLAHLASPPLQSGRSNPMTCQRHPSVPQSGQRSIVCEVARSCSKWIAVRGHSHTTFAYYSDFSLLPLSLVHSCNLPGLSPAFWVPPPQPLWTLYMNCSLGFAQNLLSLNPRLLMESYLPKSRAIFRTRLKHMTASRRRRCFWQEIQAGNVHVWSLSRMCCTLHRPLNHSSFGRMP